MDYIIVFGHAYELKVFFHITLPQSFRLDLIVRFIILPLIIHKRRDSGHSWLTLLDNGKGLDRKPLFEILDSVFL